MCGHCLMVVDRCAHAHTCTAQVTHGEDGCSDSEIRTEKLLLTQVQYLLRHMSLWCVCVCMCVLQGIPDLSGSK